MRQFSMAQPAGSLSLLCSTFESSATRLLRQSHTTHSEHRGWLARFSCLRASPVADSKVGRVGVACSHLEWDQHLTWASLA